MEELKIKLAIVGSRGFDNYELLCKETKRYLGKVSEVISGGALGADKLGECWAREHGIPVTVLKPDWDKYGRGAGIIRNTEIVKMSDEVLAFWDGKSRGTEDTFRKAVKAGKECIVVRY